MKRIFAFLLMVFFLCSCVDNGHIKAGQVTVTFENNSSSSTDSDATSDQSEEAEETLTGYHAGYTLVWSDEFEGTTLDESKWTAELNGNGNGNSELQYYRAVNISVGPDESGENGALKITARKESYSWASFTSGRLKTKNNFEFTYGICEARIMFPKTKNGLWPAFWLLGANYSEVSWPRCGEVDIVEMGNATGISSGTQETYLNGACHWGYYENGAYPNYAKHSNMPYSVQDGEYHLFTLIWTETYIRMYLDLDEYPDRSPYYEMAISMSDSSNGWDVGHYFHHDYFILLNLAVGGSFTGIYNASGITALPNDGDEAYMYVDWVRVYQK